MRIKVIEGNLFDSKETYLCHQCNCISQSAAHLAADVFAQYPWADTYSGRTTPNKPGTIAVMGDGVVQRYVINLYGQYYPGKKYPESFVDGRHVRRKFFESCLAAMFSLQGSFAFPWRIGCGAAGGDWDVYMDYLEDFAFNKDVVLYRLPSVSL